jgi:hypothetical protein
MKKEFEDYLRSISLTATLMGKVDSIYEMYRSFCPEEIKWIFVADYITNEGERVFEELWCFSENYLMNSPQFASSDELIMARIERPLLYFRIVKHDYDLQKATDKSRIKIEFRLSAWPDATGDMKASGENCSHLWKLFLTYLIKK